MPSFRTHKYVSRKGTSKKRTFKSKASFQKKKFSLKLKRKTGMTLTKIISKPRLFVKLNWFFQEDATIDTGSPGITNIPVYPMSAAPLDFPGGSTPLSSGNIIYTGLEKYAQYYSRMRVHAAKVTYKIQIQPETGGSTTTALPYLNCAVVALPLQVDGEQNPANVVSLVGAYTYEQIASYPSSKTGQLQQALKSLKLSVFRKTASMFNKRSIRDDPNSSNIINPSLAHANWYTCNNQWYTLLSMQNSSGVTAYANVQCKITAFCELYNNSFAYEQTLT